MGPTTVILAPWHAAKLVLRAADDLNAVARRARQEPHPVDEVQADLRVMMVELAALVRLLQELIVGGDDLRRTAAVLDAHTVELIDGGAELTDTAKVLTVTVQDVNVALQAFRAALPRLLDTLETVEHLETAVETVAETVEPLQGVATKVGRLTQRRAR
ncbi:MAG: hypothetical protein JWP18_620 [Solirubrobacterales bacterium]|nr:hypothetical protein [Solirubrobacterales bacterium]